MSPTISNKLQLEQVLEAALGDEYCDPSILPEEFLGFSGPVGNGVENEFPGPSGPGAQKVKTESKKRWKFQLLTFLTLFRL